MAYTGNPAESMIDRIRLEVGDIDEFDEGLSDNVYQFILDVNGDTTTGIITPKSIMQALKYLVGKYANFVHEEAGDLEVWDNRYQQYSSMLDKFIKDPRMGVNAGGAFAGGISLSDIENNTTNTDANLTKPSEGWFRESINTTLRT